MKMKKTTKMDWNVYVCLAERFYFSRKELKAK